MKVLIVRFSSIGDIVLTTPVIRCLRKQTGAEIHYLTKEGFGGIIQPNPHVQKVYTIRKHIGEVLSRLEQERYDYVIDLHKNLRTVLLQIRLGKKALTFDKANLQKWMMVHFKKPAKGVAHIVRRYIQALKPLGVRYDGAGLDYFLQPAGENFALPPSPFVCFAIGGTHATKRMPVEKIVALCRQLTVPVYLLGGREDQPVGEVVAGAVAQVYNRCGHLTLSDSARMISHADLVLTHDTGLMHIAAAFEKPILSIWGNTVPEFGMTPFFPDGSGVQSDLAEVRDLSCRPCSKIGYSACPKGHFRCMRDQQMDLIARMAEDLLSDNRPT
jgi:ADP-heptose:LPS heptosyltransferase